MAIDPTLDPDMYVFGNAPKALKTVITTHANMLYGQMGDPTYCAKTTPHRGGTPETEALRVAIKTFYKAAAQGMQFEMDRLSGQGKPTPHFSPR